MRIHGNRLLVLVVSSALALSVFTALGAAMPASSATPRHHITREPGTPASQAVITDPAHLQSSGCVVDNPLPTYNDTVGSNTVQFVLNAENCSGQQYVDSITWKATSGAMTLKSWYFYSTCGDWFSSASGSPNVYLQVGGSSYTGGVHQNVNSQWNASLDNYYYVNGGTTKFSGCV